MGPDTVYSLPPGLTSIQLCPSDLFSLKVTFIVFSQPAMKKIKHFIYFLNKIKHLKCLRTQRKSSLIALDFNSIVAALGLLVHAPDGIFIATVVFMSS